MSNKAPWRFSWVTLAIIVGAVALLEVFTPCSGYVIDHGACWAYGADQAAVEVARTFEEIASGLAP